MACEPAHLFPSTGYLFTLSLSLSLSCLSISLRDTVQLNQHSGSAFDGSRSLQCSVLFECVCVGVGMGVGVPRAGPLIIHQNWCLDYLRWRLSCHHHPNQFVVSLICNGMYSFFLYFLRNSHQSFPCWFQCAFFFPRHLSSLRSSVMYPPSPP